MGRFAHEGAAVMILSLVAASVHVLGTMVVLPVKHVLVTCMESIVIKVRSGDVT